MSVITLTSAAFKNEVISSDKPVLIDFFAEWCGPCSMVSPVVDEIAEENDGVKVCKVDVDGEPQLAQAFDVSSIPTLVVMNNGKEVSRAVGYRSKNEILAMLKV